MPKSPRTQSINPTATQRIIASARRHFFAHGFRSVTMDDLARELGMSKKTLYASFRAKSFLLKAVIEDKLQNIETDLHRSTADCSDISRVLHDLLACLQRHTGEIQPPFVRDIQREPELFTMVENRRRILIRRYFGKFFDQARKTGMVRKDIAATIITEMLLASVQAILNPGRMTELGLTPRTGFTAIITVILEGVLAQAKRPRS